MRRTGVLDLDEVVDAADEAAANTGRGTGCSLW